jgi:predicted RNA-binding Zn ribbon-like protein
MVIKRQDAPGELELVRAFVNTLDVEGGADEFLTPVSLAEWLSARGLLEPGARAGKEELEQVVAVRRALRALLLANNGGVPDPGAAATLDEAARRAGVALRFLPDGNARQEPAAGGLDGAIGRLLAIVATAQADATWVRLKACRNGACLWAFYDRARNRSRTWCSMAVCGNRAKARAYRGRRSAAGR